MPKAMFYGSPNDLAVDSQGRLFVSQIVCVSFFDPNGNYLQDFKTDQAFGLAFNDQDELLIASRPFVVKYKIGF
jgi:sugar lactone lactonase YvrE